MATQSRLQTKLTELLDCLSSVDGLINCHVANFFTHNLWSAVLPPRVVQELEQMNDLSKFPSVYQEYIQNGTRLWGKNCPNLDNFLVKSNTMSIRTDTSCLTPLYKLSEKMVDLGYVMEPSIKLKDFMSEKKMHEVEKTAPLAQALAQLTGTQHIVDIGGGKGYLSSSLSLQCGLHVLALDSSAITTCGASRLEKMMAKRTRLTEPVSCHREILYVSPQLALDPLLKKHFGLNTEKAGVLGLHTCGNLATTCCQMFVRQNVPWLVNVGCCYHLIHEQFEGNTFWSNIEMNNTEDWGFPMSAFLINKKTKLGRNARMLAAHSLERLIRDGVKEEAALSLFYRALLQGVIVRVKGHDLVEGQVGRLFKKCASFNQYIRKAVQKLQLNVNLSEQDIDELLCKHADQEAKLRTFFLLRIHFAPLVESVILLDRLLYLLEQGIEDAHLVPLYDPALSPRNHAIVAWRPIQSSCS